MQRWMMFSMLHVAVCSYVMFSMLHVAVSMLQFAVIGTALTLVSGLELAVMGPAVKRAMVLFLQMR
jgi:hypothetical protein